MQSIKVRHNAEMAHRLWQTEGKCRAIHGHSYQIELEIGGDVDERGILGGLEFAEVKKWLRDFIDKDFDHHVLLNRDDPVFDVLDEMGPKMLPGVTGFNVDPSTENFAKYIGQRARDRFTTKFQYRVTVWETPVNCATWDG